MLKLIGILACVAVAYAAVARYPPEPKPEKYANQEGCYFSKYDIVLPYGVPYNSGEAPCGQYVCQKATNETLWETCGVIAIRDGCRKSSEDLTKDYPDCCSEEVCDANPQGPVVACAHAESGGGRPPVTETYASGPGASANASAS